MADIVLSTLNAKYIHASFGLRYLLANLGPLQPRAHLIEFDIHQRPLDIAEAILALNPRILGLGVYIWNVHQTTQLVAALKRLRPGLLVVLGGPEVSHETEGQPLVDLADMVITGEADLAFAEACAALLLDPVPARKIVPATLPEMSRVALPYSLYTDEDLRHRVVYVEASRGCPFTCEFCLSSLDIPVRQVPLEPLFAQLQQLLDRGLQQFKFVDRTFNLNLNVSRAILQFFLERHQPGRFYHFEMIPDRLPSGLRDLIRRFPAGSIQFEVGIQTFNPEVSQRISRRQNLEAMAENFRFLREETGVHIHADLIVGLPGESLESFGQGFDRLVEMRPQEIQVGILKRLRGTPIIRHDAEWGMIYSPDPPYEILQNRTIGFADMQRMRRFARYWDLVGNSGNFLESAPRIWGDTEWGTAKDAEDAKVQEALRSTDSPFSAFLRFSDWVYGRLRRTDQIALVTLSELLLEYLTREMGQDRPSVALSLWNDFRRPGRVNVPEFLRGDIEPEPRRVASPRTAESAPKRQRRHALEGGTGQRE